MKKIILSFVLFAIIIIATAQTKSIIYFDSNKSELKKMSKHLLDSLSTTLQHIDNYQVVINAYCDNTGSNESNQTLSEKRANAVFDYLKNQNLPSQYMSKKGFGETFPIASNDNETGKAQNRRVEITVNINVPVQTPLSMLAPSVKKTETFNDKSSANDLEVGKTLILKNLNFEGGTAVLLPEAKPTLEMLLKIMQDNPTLEIEIGGHVCCADDMPLSILRAESVYKYLIRKGIDELRLTYKGYSRNKPIFEDDTDEAKARINRRVEITVLKK
jgi:outer membrane protein OmpA-like peptidoglycan-associated protein